MSARRVIARAAIGVVTVGGTIAGGVLVAGRDSDSPAAVGAGARDTYEAALAVVSHHDRALWLAEVCAGLAVDGGSGAPADRQQRLDRLESRGRRHCWTDNQREERLVELTPAFNDVVRTVVNRAVETPDLRAAWDEWRACMAAGGHEFADQPAIVRTLAAEREAIGYVASTAEEVAAHSAAVAAHADRERVIGELDDACFAQHVEDAEATALAASAGELTTEQLATLDAVIAVADR